MKFRIAKPFVNVQLNTLDRRKYAVYVVDQGFFARNCYSAV